jgi:hypothetical protein
LSFMIAYLVRG